FKLDVLGDYRTRAHALSAVEHDFSRLAAVQTGFGMAVRLLPLEHGIGIHAERTPLAGEEVRKDHPERLTLILRDRGIEPHHRPIVLVVREIRAQIAGHPELHAPE